MSSIADPVASASVTATTFTTAPAASRKGTLLIVDDEEGPRQALRMVFKGAYDLLLAEDGPSALALAGTHAIDVAVMDIRMPGMSGIELLEKLRVIQPALEAVIITAFETTDTMRQALRLRACDYINKPFDISTIRNAVAQAMQRRLLEGDEPDQGEQVRELLADLQNKTVEEQMARTQRDIYASIIHDINSPLTVISGFVQILNQKLARTAQFTEEELEFVKERLRIIERQAANCIEIPRRYLGFLRRQRDDAAAASVNQLLRDLEQLARVNPNLKENELHVTPLAADCCAKINGIELIQILLNLTVNGLQCDPQPHLVEISGETLAAPLNLAQFKDGPHDRLLNVEGLENAAPLVKLWVRDYGPGIPADVLPNIFQSYFTTKSQGQGTGLGLTIVQRMIKDAHGALHVHSQPGKGTTFTVYLPGGNPPVRPV